MDASAHPLDIAALPFDADEMLKGLRTWVECESPTWDASAVNRMMDLASRDLAVMGARIERIPGRMGLGDCVRATLPHPRMGEPGILICGHFDTVHPVGTLAKLPFRREGDRAYGPGIFDMKGGNYLTLEAIRQLTKAGIETPLPITLLFTPDEEIGTPSVRDLIEAEARPPPRRPRPRARPRRAAASPPAATPSRASTSPPPASPPTPAPASRTAAPRSRRWRPASSRSTP